MTTPTPGASGPPTTPPASPAEANRPPDVTLLREQVERLLYERDNWMETARQEGNGREYYRGLVVRCGQAFGKAAHIADDGSDMQDVLCAKVPELVEALVAERAPNPTDTRPPATLPWQDASDEHYGRTAQTPPLDVLIRRACEQWARYSCENWRRHDAEMHKALVAGKSQCDTLRAQRDECERQFQCKVTEIIVLTEQLNLCRTVLEQCRPMVKAHLLEMERFGPGDESIITRIEQARKVGL